MPRTIAVYVATLVVVLCRPARADYDEWKEHPEHQDRVFYRVKHGSVNEFRVKEGKPAHSWCMELRHAFPAPTRLTWAMTEWGKPRPGRDHDWRTRTLAPNEPHESCIHFLDSPKGNMVLVWIELVGKPAGDDQSGPGRDGGRGATGEAGRPEGGERGAGGAQGSGAARVEPTEPAAKPAEDPWNPVVKVHGSGPSVERTEQVVNPRYRPDEGPPPPPTNTGPQPVEPRKIGPNQEELAEWMDKQRQQQGRSLDSYALHNQQQYAGLAASAQALKGTGAEKFVLGAFGVALIGGTCLSQLFVEDPTVPRILCSVPIGVVGTGLTIMNTALHFSADRQVSARKVWFDPGSALSPPGEDNDFLSFRTGFSYESLSLDGFDMHGAGIEATGRMAWLLAGARLGLRWSQDARTMDGRAYRALPTSLMFGLQPFTGTVLSPYAGVMLTANLDGGPALADQVDPDNFQWMIGNVSYLRWFSQRGRASRGGGAFLRDLFLDVRLLGGGGGDLPNGIMFSIGTNTRFVGGLPDKDGTVGGGMVAAVSLESLDPAPEPMLADESPDAYRERRSRLYLRLARAAIDAGNHHDAHKYIARHRAELPDGLHAAEIEGLAVVTMCGFQYEPGAKALATDFLARWPAHALAPQMRRLLDEGCPRPAR